MDKSMKQFLVVAEQKSLSMAARKLFISQPTLTHNIKKLEESLQVELFIRSPKGMELTHYGEVLLEQARIMQRVHDNTLNKIQSMRLQHQHGLSIGVGFAWWKLFFRTLFHEYRQRYPTVPANIDVSNHLRSMDQLLCGDIDLFIGHKILGLSRRAGVAFLPLLDAYDGSFVRVGHPLLGRPCHLEEQFNYPFMAVTPDENRLTEWIIETPELKDVAPKQLYHATNRQIYSSNSMTTAIDIVLETNAILNYPACMYEFFQDNGLEKLDTLETIGPFCVGIYVLSDRLSDTKIMEITALIQEHVSRIKNPEIILLHTSEWTNCDQLDSETTDR
ncbi:LysR family transcriptional regulator [Gynuella sunshinyii]|uniref:Transcriptional regulator n=1 Tax=Gynuella sunshinyii YC6258 TaxID=1445510 RepID=A0A0C5V6H0_9GAMM|nr:LysR family transcriptional regulator [Gynuella sunshinyii]AJQ95055.1 transcriptional regulator [Gynuella sunshinyii YC6258]